MYFSSEIHPPNLNADLYKEYKGPNSHRILTFIDIHEDGSTLVGGSDQNGRYWEGMVDYTTHPTEFLGNINDVMSTPMENSVTDGLFLANSSRMVICDDKGDIRVWIKGLIWSEISGTGNEQDTWSNTAEASDHDSAILAIDLFPGEENVVVTGGADNCIKIWDLTNMLPTISYSPAHTYMVSDVACNPSIANTFASSSLDGSVAIWDTKSKETLAKVYRGPPCGARCVCWLSATVFAIGYDNGDVHVHDMRQDIPDSNVFSFTRDFPIEKLEYNAESKMLGLVGDTNTVSVYEFGEKSDLKLVLQNSDHTDYVRGLSWDKTNTGILYSVGWDDKILQHRIIVP